jgi:hypothetical protein
MDKDKILYSLEITNGYAFRQIFELYSKLFIQGIPIFFKEDGMTIRTGNSRKGRQLISDIEIFGEDIIEYYFNKDLAKVKSTEETTAYTPEQFNIGLLQNSFKAVAKNNSLRIYKTDDSPDTKVEIKGLTTQTSTIVFNKFHSIEYDLSEFEDLTDVPNFKLEISQFCVTMKNIIRGDPEYISFKVFKNGLAIESWNSAGIMMNDSRWNVDEKDYKENKFLETKINTPIAKAFCKISSMTIHSIIKIFSDKKGYLKMSHKIADFGEHNIYLIDNIEDEKEDN